MVAFPVSYLISTLTPFNVCKFKDKTFAIDAPPHFYIVANIDDNKNILLVWIISEYRKRQDIYNFDSRASECVVQVTNDELPFLSYESGIDCNKACELSKQELLDKISTDYKFEIVARDIPDKIKNRILSAIKRSPAIPRSIKKKLAD